MADETFAEWCVIDETWRPVVGFEGVYEVSSIGQVRRVGRAARTGRGRGGGARVGRVLKHQSRRGGYRAVLLWRDGRQTTGLIHRLVAAAFLGPCPPGHEVNHRDGVKTNNRVDNLEYLTRSENNRHAWRSGLREGRVMPMGEAHHNAKLTAAQVAEIRRLYRPRTYGTTRLGREFGVNHRTIRDIVTGKNWKDVRAA